MKTISYHKIQAIDVQSEITANAENSWFRPKGKPNGKEGVGDFDYGQMQFLNKNLNYFYFENMVSHAVKNNYSFDSKYKKTLEFLESLRNQLNEPGPFGRMCVWKLEPGCYLLPHRDNWEYHQHITRYIFFVSDHSNSNTSVVINQEKVEVKQGLLLKFFPATELHEFSNHSNSNFYFIGFDYWNLDLLEQATQKTKIDKDTVLFYEEGYGGNFKKTMYMSKE